MHLNMKIEDNEEPIDRAQMKIRFAGNSKVTAEYNGYTIATDQPKADGGDETAPAPMDLIEEPQFEVLTKTR